MMTEKMEKALEDVRLLEKDLMRDLTIGEKTDIITNGWKHFLFETLGMDIDDYRGLQQIRRIVSAYCTQSQDEYEKVLKGDISIAYLAMKSIVNDMEDEIFKDVKKEKVGDYTITTTQSCKCGVGNKICCSDTKVEDKECSRKDYKSIKINCSGEAAEKVDFDKELDEADTYCCTNPECNKSLEKVENTINCLRDVLNAIPETDEIWIKEYNKADPDHTELIGLITDYLDDEDGNFDELCGDILDVIKDSVIEETAKKLLANKGKSFILDEVILDEVFDYLMDTNDNIRVQVINNQITVR